MSELMTEMLPPVRCTPEIRQGLEQIAAQSVTKNLADHIRYAVTQYINHDGVSALAPETVTVLRQTAQDLGYVQSRVLADDDERVLALVDHWDRTKKDCYGIGK